MTNASDLNFDPIPMSVSMPEAIAWHMIFDHELSQLSRPETGVIGSLGFVGMGGALGLIPSFATAVEKVGVSPIQLSDVACIGAFFGSVVLTIVCLSIAGMVWWRNKHLAGQIRQRTRRGLRFGARDRLASP